MRITNHLFALLLICFIILSSKVYAVQDSLFTVSAKAAWNKSSKKIEYDYAVQPVLFKAYPESNLDKSDTTLCTEYQRVIHGRDSVIWNGRSYKWVFECRIPELSKDSMFRITTYFKLSYPVTITIETIYKPITDYVDTIGIAEGTWFDSDLLDKFQEVADYGFHPVVYLERGLSEDHQTVQTFWNKQSFFEDGSWIDWLEVDAQTGKVIKYTVVSVSEEDTPQSTTVNPNPASSQISIQTNNVIHEVSLFSYMGEKVYTWTEVQPNQKLSVSEIPVGMYMVRYQENVTIRSIPIVISR